MNDLKQRLRTWTEHAAPITMEEVIETRQADRPRGTRPRPIVLAVVGVVALACFAVLVGLAVTRSPSRVTVRNGPPRGVSAKQSQPGWEGSGPPVGYASHVRLVRSSQVHLLVIPGVANWWASCTPSGHSVVSLALTDRSGEVVVATGTRTVAYPDPGPGYRITIALETSSAATVHIAQVGEGDTAIATVQIAVGPVPGTSFACDVSAQAVVTQAGYTFS